MHSVSSQVYTNVSYEWGAPFPGQDESPKSITFAGSASYNITCFRWAWDGVNAISSDGCRDVELPKPSGQPQISAGDGAERSRRGKGRHKKKEAQDALPPSSSSGGGEWM
jgi:hypothetical protein